MCTHIVCVRYVYYLLLCAYWTRTIGVPEQVVRISDTDDICIMDNRPCLICIPGQIVLGMHIVCVQYAYNKCVHISSVSDMHTINVYAYHLCPICILPALVRILDTDNMCTRAGGMHIVRVRYAYNQCVCILDMDNMCTTCSSMHI